MPDVNHAALQGLGYWEINKLHYHTGTPVEVVFRTSPEPGDDGRLTGTFVDPGGEQGVPELRDNGAGSHTLSFTPEHEGYYQLLIEQEGAASTHLAKAILPVGHHLHGALSPVGSELELVPSDWTGWQAGDSLRLRAVQGGQPAAGVAVTLFYRGPLDAVHPVTIGAGGEGEVEFVLSQPGFYVAVARAEADRGGPELIASLPVLVTKATHRTHDHHDDHNHNAHHHHQ